MSRGKRYDSEPKLNFKKVFAVIIAIAVIIMFIFIMKEFLTKETSTGSIDSKSYFAVYKDNKWGVINSSGNYVIEPSYSEMIVVPNSKLGVFVVTYNTKVLNEKDEKILTEYENVEAIPNQDKNGNLCYAKNVLKFQKEGKYGLIDFKGKNILPAEYQEITAISGIENSLKIKKDDKYGIANEEGKIIIEPKYADIDILGKDDKSGFIVKDDLGKYGIINYLNEQVIETQYNSVEKVYGNDLYVVSEGGTQKLVNKQSEDVLTTGFDAITQILSGEENMVIFRKNNKYGIMDLSGQVKLEAKYDSLKQAKVGLYIAQRDGKYGIININDEEKLAFNYTSIVYNEKADIYIAEDENFNSSILNSNLETKITGILLELNETKGYLKLRIENNYKYYNFKFEEKQESDIFPNKTLFLSKNNEKYGYIDKNGKVVVDYIYDDATEQNDYGYAAVKKDGKWGSIDNKGKVIQEPTYNLDEYLLIDFIGRWHLGLDINMNYYNQL